jgi:hypothetical protein
MPGEIGNDRGRASLEEWFEKKRDGRRVEVERRRGLF